MNNLKPIQIEFGVHVRAPSGFDAPSFRPNHPKLPPSVPNRNDKLFIVQRKEVPVTDPDGQRKGEVECELGRRVDSDVVELESCELKSWIWGVEEKYGGEEEEEDAGESDGTAETTVVLVIAVVIDG